MDKTLFPPCGKSMLKTITQKYGTISTDCNVHFRSSDARSPVACSYHFCPEVTTIRIGTTTLSTACLMAHRSAQQHLRSVYDVPPV